MRSLQASDIFAFCRVVTAVGIKDELKKICMEADSIEDIKNKKEEYGYELVFNVFEKATQENSEKKLFEFFANIFEMDVDEVRALDPVIFLDKILEIASVDKWKNFFSRVASLMR